MIQSICPAKETNAFKTLEDIETNFILRTSVYKGFFALNYKIMIKKNFLIGI